MSQAPNSVEMVEGGGVAREKYHSQKTHAKNWSACLSEVRNFCHYFKNGIKPSKDFFCLITYLFLFILLPCGLSFEFHPDLRLDESCSAPLAMMKLC